MKRIVILLTAAVVSLAASAQSAQDVLDSMVSGELLRTSLVGVYVRTASGQVLLEHNAQTKMQPASNMKLITTGCALHELGPDFKFETRLAYDGTIKKGTLKGDLYIVGGGDPTLFASDSIAAGKDEVFAQWKEILTAAGIRNIAGRVIGDGRFLDGEEGRTTWSFSEYGGSYSTGMTGLAFRKNLIKFRISPGAEGEELTAEMLEPVLPWLKVDVVATTAAGRSGKNFAAYTNDISPVIQFRGSIGADAKASNVNVANKYGAMTVAYLFSEYLKSEGMKVKGGCADIDRHGRIRDTSFEQHETAVSQDRLYVIGSTFSPCLARIARETNHRSDNFYAEALLRTVGRLRTGEDSYRRCWAEEKKILAGLGVDTANRIRLDDGSGVSKLNYISPEFFTDYLQAMMASPNFGAFRASLPGPGSNGTMKPVLKDLTPAQKARIRMKSGGIAGVCCYSGYIFPEKEGDEVILFSILTGNATAARSDVRAEIMRLIAALVNQY